MTRHTFTTDTDVDFDAQVLQTTELYEIYRALEHRRTYSDICLWCERAIVWQGGHFVHEADRGERTCEDDRAVEPYEDPLDEDEQDTCELLKELNDTIDGGLAEQRSLINDDDFVKQIREEHEDNVPESYQSYVDWDRFADDLRSDHTTVTIGDGRYTYHYTG